MSDLPGPTWNTQEIETSCDGRLHPLAIKGIMYFNQHKFFEAHEELELAWREESGAIRDLYRGILQVGLAYYHILRGNYRGAVKMFLRCRNWLEPYPSVCRGVDVERVRQDYNLAEAELLRLGPAHIAEFSPTWMAPIKLPSDTITSTNFPELTSDSP